MRAQSSGVHLTAADAAVVKGMIERGDRQHDIAAWFGVNGGRIAEISTGHTFSDTEPQLDKLPPAGPYPSAHKAAKQAEALRKVRDKLDSILKETDNPELNEVFDHLRSDISKSLDD